jgi:hypothetical protein
MNLWQGVRLRGVWLFLVVVSLFLAAPSAAQQRRQPPPGWLEQLPAIATVRTAILGTDAADTAARQETAMAVMMDVIEGLTGVSHMDATSGKVPQPAKTRWLEYMMARGKGPAGIYLSVPARRYYGNLDYHQEVLSKLVSPSVKSAYESSGRYQDLVMLMPPANAVRGPNGELDCATVLRLIAEGRVEENAPVTRHCDQESMRAAFAERDSQVKDGQYRECLQAQKLMANGLAANAAPLQEKCDEKRRHAAEGAAQLAEQERHQRIQSGRGLANSVLGFELGKETKLLPCQDATNEDALLIAQKMTEIMGVPANRRPSNPNIAVTAACSLGTNDPGINGFLDSFDLNKVNKRDQGPVTTLFVRLPVSDRPSWMSSGMSNASFALVLVNDVAIGALIKGLHTGNSEAIIEAVTEKYPKTAHTTERVTCSNDYGASRSLTIHHWTMNGLTVIYDPTGTGRCRVAGEDINGTLMFKTDTWLKMEKQRQVKQKASDAKL